MTAIDQLAAEDQARAAIEKDINEQGFALFVFPSRPGAFTCDGTGCTAPATDELNLFTEHHLAEPNAAGATFRACPDHRKAALDDAEECYGKPVRT
ncbi:hypothetical protein [Streptomyces sp. PH10-H1]|uniref:hypothetical protein n=1 Tax=Streptomyces sp. PH10-H1 TaxID=3046212 RepID=UPI0024BA811D|nr:hypothetical protein [Streptomyces sp. PH10-H1]MDJ0341778.1 hypothetical protein [Streptomyces sp. PH10-H1]